MKNIFESAEVMTAYAQIDLGYYGMKELQKEMDKPRSNIESMIDDATGHGKAKIIEWTETAIGILEMVIENKKFIEADYSRDETILITLKQKLNNQ